MILAWRNSIGDLTAPVYDPWSAVRATAAEKGNYGQIVVVSIIIFLIWVHWFLTQVLMLILLFNFLVAYVDQSFGEVVDTDKVSYYERRAFMNCEYLNFKKLMGTIFPSW